jgi:ABC-2 type transport system permease protein
MTNVDQPPAPVAEIFDLGYRAYEGPRLGRRFAVRSLVVYSVRNTFGLGRGGLPKVLAFGLAAIALVPAVVTVIGGAIGGKAFELVEHHDYFEFIQVIIVLFVAAMASDLVGNDRKNDTLPLYFSRPVERDDYVLAKIAALALALLSLTLLPQLLVFVGNWLGASDGADWFTDNAADLWRIAASSALASLQLAVVGVAIAMFTTRRAFALTSVLAALWGSRIAAEIIVPLVSPDWAAVTLLASPLQVMNAATLVIFDAIPATAGDPAGGGVADQVAYAGLSGWVWLTAAAAQTGMALLLAVRHYRKADL